MTGASPGDRELDRAAPAGTSVPCPLRHHQAIAMVRCLEYQRDNGCHCEHALVAIARVEQIAGERGEGFDEELVQLRARAEEIEKHRPPAPPAKETVMAEEKQCSKCGWPLRADNTKGICGVAAACRRRASLGNGGGAARAA